ncbi:MAG TPA: chloride channel protein, partial [Polyangiaceae bacterium]
MVPVGILAGLGVGMLETVCNRLLWGRLGAQALYLRLLWPIVGLTISASLLHRLRVRTVGLLNEVVIHYHAPPETLSPEDDATKLAACVATVGLGASAGLGGPSQWLGARIALYVDRELARFRSFRMQNATHPLLVGAAAGVSAIFRAPLTGTLLALETPFARDIDGTALVPASLAAITAHVVHGLLVDNAPLLPFPDHAPTSRAAFFQAALLGVAAGFLSRRFQRVMMWTRLRTGHLEWWQRGVLGGVVTSATALVAWHFYGDTWTLQAGLPLADALFAAKFVGLAALALLVLKIISVWATFGTSGVADLLVVTLTMGALLGASCVPLLPAL